MEKDLDGKFEFVAFVAYIIRITGTGPKWFNIALL